MRRARRAAGLALAALLAAAGAARADGTALKDGMPCLDGICVGDDAASLHHVPWEPALDEASGVPLADTRASPAALERLRAALRGDDAALEAVAPYWVLRRLDAAGLRALAGIRAVCEPLGVAGRLHARYVDAAGRAAVVSFEPVAAQPGATPRFVVASIVQHVAEDDAARRLEIGREIAARYDPIGPYAGPSRPGAAWIPTAVGGPQLKLLAPFGDPVERAENLRSHAECADAQDPPREG